MATNPLDFFKENFQNATGVSTDEYLASKRNENAVTARSGNNIQFDKGYTTGLSDNYKNTFNDIVKFYQKEFNLTPRVHVGADVDDMPPNVNGVTYDGKDSDGNFLVKFRRTWEEDEEDAKNIAKEATAHEWHPKNSDSIAHVPVHEFGHALLLTLFPKYDTSSNAEKWGDGELKSHDELVDATVHNALNDLGISSKDQDKYLNEVDKISRYAGTRKLKNPDGSVIRSPIKHEVVAEALSDYYFNRDKSAPLSKAIVKQLKNRGSMFATKQSGGIDLDTSSNNFTRNLRRYSAIQ